MNPKKKSKSVKRNTFKQRREFIKKAAVGATGLAIGGLGFSAKSYASIIGSNDRINLALMGIRTQGSHHINQWCNMKDSHNVNLRVLCDVDELLFEAQLKKVFDKTKVKPSIEWDFRKVLEYKDVDAVAIASPNHWHALAAIWACQAGKHVYVEKPASHNIWEGRKMIEASRKYNLLMQVGFQSRAFNHIIEAVKFLHDGGIGEVYMARALCFKIRDSYGMSKDSTPPSTFHYDLWLGPAPYRPYNEKKTHYNWHWYWDTGNGDTGNTGPHNLDIARWGLNKHEHPVEIHSSGGIYGFNQDECQPGKCTPGTMGYGGVETYGHDKTIQETPNIQSSIFKYADGKLIQMETRDRYTYFEGSLGSDARTMFFGTEGWLEIGNKTWKAYRRRETEPFAQATVSPANQSDSIFTNFIDALRAGNKEVLKSEIHEGFYSSALPLLANISYRVGRSLTFINEHEKFINDPEADTLLTRVYRKPYVVPDKV